MLLSRNIDGSMRAASPQINRVGKGRHLVDQHRLRLPVFPQKSLVVESSWEQVGATVEINVVKEDE